MAIDIVVARTLHGLSPRTAYDAELLGAYAIGKDLNAKITQKRSARHHRFYWALIEKVRLAIGKFPTADSLHTALKLHLGYLEPVITLTGEIKMQAKSTSWSAMDDHDFRVFFEAALSVILSDLLPGVKRYELLREVEEMLGVTFDSLWSDQKVAA